MPQRTTAERFWAKVHRPGPIPPRRPELGPCWVWVGGGAGYGYGQFWNGGRYTSAHRFAVEFLVGPIPEGMQPDHLCGVRRCVKAIADQQGPAHLEVVTPAENMARTRRIHCPKGHPYDEANTVIWGGRRYCRACHQARKPTKRQERARRLQREVGPENAAKTHCPKGHPYSGPNLRVDSDGGRRCRACESEQNRKRPGRQR